MAPKSAIFRINGLADECLPKRFLKQDFFLSKHPPDMLHILMRSRGGDLGYASEFVGLLSELKQRGSKIITISYDFVSSSALPIFAFGDVRIANNAKDTFFFHRATGKDRDVKESDILSGEQSAFTLLSEQFSIPLDQIYTLADTERKLTAMEAKDLGVVHKIL